MLRFKKIEHGGDGTILGAYVNDLQVAATLLEDRDKLRDQAAELMHAAGMLLAGIDGDVGDILYGAAQVLYWRQQHTKDEPCA